MAGTVGAIFNGALQLGSAIGIAAVSSIETSIEDKDGNPSGYVGRAAAFWFLLGVIGLEIISISVFYKVEAEHMHHHSARSDETEVDAEKGDHAEIYEERRSSDRDIKEREVDVRGGVDVEATRSVEKLEDVQEETLPV